MNGFLLMVTISLLVAVQIQTGVSGQNGTQGKPTTPPRPVGITVKVPANHAQGGAPTLINVGTCSFFFFANTFVYLFYLS